MAWALITPRYDYASAAAAERAYAQLASRRTRLVVLLLSGIGISGAFSSSSFQLGDSPEPRDRQLLQVFWPVYLSFASVYVVLFALAVVLARHTRTVVRAEPGSDAASWYEATVANVVREGRLLLRGALLGAGITAILCSAGAAVLAWASGAAPRWDEVGTMLVPALAFLVAAALAGRRRIRQPEEQLRPLKLAFQSRSVAWLTAGALIVFVSAVMALFGDAILGYRHYTDSAGYAGVEFPVVVTRVWQLPFLSGLLAATGWLVIALRMSTPRARSITAIIGAAVTTWIAAVVNPANGDGTALLWFGALPALFVLFALLSWPRADGTARQAARAVNRPAS